MMNYVVYHLQMRATVTYLQWLLIYIIHLPQRIHLYQFYLSVVKMTHVTGGTLGLVDSISTLQKNGICKYRKIITFPKMRHEILNEKENHLVIEKIIKFINQHQ